MGKSLCYFNPYLSFWSCIKLTYSKQNKYEGVKITTTKRWTSIQYFYKTLKTFVHYTYKYHCHVLIVGRRSVVSAVLMLWSYYHDVCFQQLPTARWSNILLCGNPLRKRNAQGTKVFMQTMYMLTGLSGFDTKVSRVGGSAHAWFGTQKVQGSWQKAWLVICFINENL